MISFDGKTSLTFSNMGLFDIRSAWIHPTVTIDTYELIYVVDGEVHIREGNSSYDLGEGDMILLCPGAEHGGTRYSLGHTSFFWLHFYCDDIAFFAVPKVSAPDRTEAERTFKQILHLQEKDRTLAELTVCMFLFTMFRRREQRDRFAYEIAEYIRVNGRKKLSVKDLSAFFGYNGDYLSRIYKREFGKDLKTGINEQRVNYIKSVLINSDLRVFEIAAECGFEDVNAFFKFFKYHTGITPTDYRNSFFRTHMNDR